MYALGEEKVILSEYVVEANEKVPLLIVNAFGHNCKNTARRNEDW